MDVKKLTRNPLIYVALIGVLLFVPTAGRSLATTSTPHPHDATDHQSPTPGYYLL